MANIGGNETGSLGMGVPSVVQGQSPLTLTLTLTLTLYG